MLGTVVTRRGLMLALACSVLVAAGCNVRITDGNDPSSDPVFSADGRYLAFSSRASNLVPGDANRVGDVFVWDRSDGTGSG